MQELEQIEIRLANALNKLAVGVENQSNSNIDHDTNRSNRLEKHILNLTDQLEAQELENNRLMKLVSELKEKNLDRASIGSDQVDLSETINKSLQEEVAHLTALRARDLAEIDDILKAIEPIIIEGQNECLT